MKRKFSILTALLIAMLTVFTITSCKRKASSQLNTDEITTTITSEDVAYVQACLDRIDQKEFKDKESFMTFVVTKQQSTKEDSVISYVPINILNRMVDVVYSKYGTITKQLVAKEYDENYESVYKYLLDNNGKLKTVIDTQEQDTTEVQDGEQSVSSAVFWRKCPRKRC